MKMVNGYPVFMNTQSVKRGGDHPTHYRKIEAGTRTGSLELIVEMAEYFHVSLDYLLLGETESNSKAKRDILTVIESLTRIAREL